MQKNYDFVNIPKEQDRFLTDQECNFSQYVKPCCFLWSNFLLYSSLRRPDQVDIFLFFDHTCHLPHFIWIFLVEVK